MGQSKRLVFFGTEDFSRPFLKMLIDRHYDVAAVVTKPDSRRGRKSKLVEPAVKTLAKKHGIKVFQPNKVAEITEALAALQADFAVLAAYGKILPKRTLDLFEPIGIINIHPSLLPRYRGPSPIEAAIINGDSKTGVSIMKLVAEMDAGPVFVQAELQLASQETKPELYDKLAALGVTALSDSLGDITSGSLKPKPQPNSSVTYTTLLTKEMSFVDPLTDDAYVIERHVRAYLGFPKTKLLINDNVVILTSTKVTESNLPGELVIDCANNTHLLIEKLVAPSGRTMSGADFKRGYC